MPIASPALTYRCHQCQWQQTVQPQSDAVVEGHTVFSKCPKCGNPQLSSERANPLAKLWGKLFQR